MERRIGEEQNNLATHKQNVENLIDSKAVEMKNIIIMIDQMKDEKSQKSKGLAQVDKELSDLETRLQELRLKRKDVLQEMNQDDEKIQKYESKRSKLEGYIDKEVIVKKERECEIKEKTRLGL